MLGSKQRKEGEFRTCVITGTAAADDDVRIGKTSKIKKMILMRTE